MYLCRLFHRNQPFVQVDARLIAEGEVSIGRDPAADWSVSDPEGLLSRVHASLGVEDGHLRLRDHSTNGTFLPDGTRAPRDRAVPVAFDDMLVLGGLMILIDRPFAGTPADFDRTTITPPPAPAEAPAPAPPHVDLLADYCAGAGIDVSALAAEDASAVMRRAGEMHRRTVEKLVALLARRKQAKADAALDRTTIGAVDNNPLKWVPPARLAADLLTARADGFLTGAAALDAGFDDADQHLAATVAGYEAAIDTLLAALSPEALDADGGAGGFPLASRAGKRGATLARVHAALVDGRDQSGGALRQSFQAAYRAASAEDGR